jgi:hypothetical protein
VAARAAKAADRVVKAANEVDRAAKAGRGKADRTIGLASLPQSQAWLAQSQPNFSARV